MATTENGIYYPNDGTKAADVLTDLKTMAESIDKNVQKNKYDDTEIKEDISDLQEEQQTQNKNIENLQTNDSKQDSLISKLKNAALNAETEEAKSLHIKDANKFGSLEVLGNQEQETREGYSIWDYLSVARSSADGLTIEKDFEEGYITVNGTPNSNYVNLCIQEDITDMLEDGQTYTLWQEKYADSNTKGIYLQVTEKTLSGTTNYFSRDNAVNFTVNKQNATYQIGLQTGTIKDTGTLINYKNRYMIYKGTDTKTYELPGATPSIKYPSEIKCLGSNKQLFDKDNANKINATPSGYTIVASSFGKSFYLEVKPNMDYSISRKIVGKRFVVCTTTQVPAAGVSLTQNIQNNIGEEINIKTGENDKYLLVYYLYNNSENEEEILSNIKVEEGTEATSYSPYGQGSTKISKINKNIYDIAKYPFTNRIAYTSAGEQVFWDGYCGILDYFPVKENTQYTFSNNLNKPILYGLVFYDKDKQFISATTSSTTTFTTTEKCEYIRFAIQSDTLPSWVQIEVGATATDYIEHQQEDYLLYIQREMLKEDYFIKEADGWKEAHGIIKIVIDGVNTKARNLKLIANNTMIQFAVDSEKALNKNGIAVSNCFKQSKNWSVINTVVISDLGTLYFHCKSDVISEITNDAMNALLQQMYEQGNPLICYATATNSEKLTCTKEQSAVLEELNNLELFEGVNNIITTEDIALLKLKYALDVETYVDNKNDRWKQVENRILQTEEKVNVLEKEIEQWKK